MPDVQYQGWVIEAQSYQSDGGRWRPKALVSIHEGSNLRTHVVPAPLERMFVTEADTDAYAMEMAVLRLTTWRQDDSDCHERAPDLIATFPDIGCENSQRSALMVRGAVRTCVATSCVVIP